MARLTAQVLAGRLDLPAEMRRRMPWPARIVGNGAGEGDHVGITCADDSLGLIIIRDQPHGDDRHGDSLLDRPGQRHLVARPDGDLLARVEPGAGNMDRGAAIGFQRLGEGNGLL